MKLLNQVTTVFNSKQQKQLDDLLKTKINSGTIQWRDVYTEQFSKRLPNLVDGLTLSRVPGSNKIDLTRLNEQLEDIEISLISIMAESETIGETISKHEMFRKDDTKSFFNLTKGYTSMINNEIKDYTTNNILVENGVVELLPSSITEYPIKSVSSEYFPDYYLEKLGNDPTPENIVPGIKDDYWLAELFVSNRGTVGAKVVLGYNAQITFNMMIFSAAGKYNMKISAIEVNDNGTWVSVPFSGNNTGKYFQLIMLDNNGSSASYSTDYVRVTFIQEKPDFVWKKEIDNEDEILTSTESEEERTFNKVIYQDTYELVEKKTLKNIFSYIFGLYYVRTLWVSYRGNIEGNFYSKKYMHDDTFRYVTIDADESKPGSSTIEYQIVQHDGSIANTYSPTGVIEPLVKIQLLDSYSVTETFSGIEGTKIDLKHFPIAGSAIVRFNGYQIRVVDSFDDLNDIQAIILKNIVYLNKSMVTSDTLELSYSHRTDYVIIHAIMKTNVSYTVVDGPRITKFDVELS